MNKACYAVKLIACRIEFYQTVKFPKRNGFLSDPVCMCVCVLVLKSLWLGRKKFPNLVYCNGMKKVDSCFVFLNISNNCAFVLCFIL